MPQLAPSLVAAAVRPVRRLTYMAAIAATLIGSLVVVRPAAGAGDCTVAAAEAAIDGDEQALLNGINAYRQQNGLPPLTLSSALSRSAAWMSRDMAVKRYFDHTDSLGRDPFTRMRDCGYSASLMGENIAAGRADPTSTIEMWKSSPSHNQAMLTSGFRAAGIGRFSDPSSPYRVYWTLDLGSMVDGGSSLPVATTTTSPTTTFPTTTTTYPTFPIQNTTTTYPTIPIQPATTTYPTVPIQMQMTATATSAQPGVITFGVSLVNAAGQVTQGDLSGYVFSITTPSGAAYSTPPTNAMGQTSLVLPAGTYTVSQLPKPGSAVMSITGAAGPGGTVTVSPGANAFVTVLNQVGGATQTTTQAATAQTSVTTGAPSFVPATTATNSTTPTSYTPATTTATTTTAATTATTMETVSLLAGCNNVSMTWSAGTPLSMVAASVTGGLKAIWRWDGARNAYLGYTTDPGAPTDYVAVGTKYEPAFVCMRTPGSLARPVA